MGIVIAGRKATFYTDTLGRVEVTGLKPGRVILRYQSILYEPLSDTLRVELGMRDTVTARLKRIVGGILVVDTLFRWRH